MKIIDLCAAQVASTISLAREQQRLNRQLDRLAVDIEQSYHSAIGQPLINIAGVLDNLLDERAPLGPLNPRQAQSLIRARDNLNRLRQQIRRLLIARQIEDEALPLARRWTDVGGLIGDVARKVEPAYRDKGITLTCAPAPDIALYIDPERIQEVLGDILTNAYKFTPGGGAVQVAVAADEQTVRIGVSDTGRGIAREDHDKVFEKFVQLPPLLKSRESGAGLGLYLAKKLMEAHGARLALASEPGTGTTLTLLFPRTHPPGGTSDGDTLRAADRNG